MAKRNSAQPHPITLAEFARRSGKNRSSITRLAQGALRVAMLPDGRIDAAHPAVAAWARGHGINPRALVAGDPIGDAGNRRRSDAAPPAATRRRRLADDSPRAEPDAEPAPDGASTEETAELDAATIARVQDMTLGEIAERYKTQTRFSGVLKNIKLAEETRYKFLDNEEQEGRLIPRDFVESRVFAGFDEIFRKLLGDLPATLVSQLYALGKADEDPEKGKAFVRDIIGAQIRSIKERMLRDLEALQAV